MSRERVQTRADPDTVEALEKYSEDVGVSKSEAVRRMLREGLLIHGYSLDVSTIEPRQAYQNKQVGIMLFIGSLLGSAVGTAIVLKASGLI